ncbi:hypothetical protein CRG98_015962 [Punica granatum]|nr:hypothetical protein CRG98_015962 [Punica granatum]
METWFLMAVTLCVAALINSLLGLLSASSGPKIPPGPMTIPALGSITWIRKDFFDVESMIRSLHAKLGPIVALHIGSYPMIYISSHSLAHQALIRNGAIFADRPPAIPLVKIISCNQHSISSASCGPMWRTLRRNLTAGILHPTRVKSFSRARRWVLGILLDQLRAAGPSTAMQVAGHFRYAVFCLQVLMCFGDRLEERQIKDVQAVQTALLLRAPRFAILNFLPSIGKILFRRQWDEFQKLLRNQENVFLPLIRARSAIR